MKVLDRTHDFSFALSLARKYRENTVEIMYGWKKNISKAKHGFISLQFEN